MDAGDTPEMQVRGKSNAGLRCKRPLYRTRSRSFTRSGKAVGVGTGKMRSRIWSTAVSLVVFLGFFPALYAKQAKKPTLAEILQRLQANLKHYDVAVPSLFCDEHAISRVEQIGPPPQEVITDSVFRLRRSPEPDHTATLVESREILKVNGNAATSQNIDAPTLLSGAFEGALAVVSLDQSACMKYVLQASESSLPNEPYVIRFATIRGSHNSENCILQENSRGRIYVDPASMHITHLELTTSHHVIIPGNSYRPPVIGKRVLTVNYTPVLLGNEAFWMPSTISLRNTGGFGFHAVVWSFAATYRNYHRLEVTSRILPGSEAPVR
jgi:hypothetical protein